MGVDTPHLDKYIRDFKKQPTLSQFLSEANSLINPMDDWIHEEIDTTQSESGSYVGNKPINERMERVGEERKLLYPAYLSWCKRKSLPAESLVNFSNSLLSSLSSLGVHTHKMRRKEGIYIQGISVKDEVYGVDHKMGSQLQLESFRMEKELTPVKHEEHELEKCQLGESVHTMQEDRKESTTLSKEIPALILPPRRPVEPLPENLYELYVNRLSEKTPLKRLGNSIAKGMPLELKDKLVGEYTNLVKLPSPEYRESVERVFSKSIEKIQKFGAIPYNYKMMGASPRVLPLSYKHSINSTKRLVRREAYTMMAPAFRKQGYAIVDFDLKSCYTSILLGLYPDKLMSIHDSIEGIGLWNSIKKQFEDAGVPERFHLHKPSVKVCVCKRKKANSNFVSTVLYCIMYTYNMRARIE